MSLRYKARPNHNKHLGALSEIEATRWLLSNGHEVFRNVSSHGIADIVAWVPGEPPTMIDVKTFGITDERNGSALLNCTPASLEQKQAGVEILYVCHKTKSVSFNPLDIMAARGLRLRAGAKWGGAGPATTKGWRKGVDGNWVKPNEILDGGAPSSEQHLCQE